MAELLLQTGMAVVPIGTGLLHGKAILEGLAWADAREAQARNAIHRGRQQDTVPVNGGILVERVPHADDGLCPVPFARPLHRHSEPAPLVGVLGGVVQEVAHHLRKPREISVDAHRLDGQGHGQLVAAGVDPVHLGMVVVFNLMIGLLTPPMGLALFLVAEIAKVTMKDVLREMMPYYVPLIVTLLLITYMPAITTWIPRLAVGGP